MAAAAAAAAVAPYSLFRCCCSYLSLFYVIEFLLKKRSFF